ncbi:hypothetical protein [Polaribacter gangjinensis]|uniref:Uncharacterized protein n=1 Tax=Polaribacter gangjinensis TaxID=574710 RepID=A0A2S7WAN5_9FLAO|nr:hypothetical protein [Polaribacter gangjinensis]PQJ74466.1 hypothetical protein BTO13_03910 [Polaribacter gangjinensis]
MEYDKIKIAKLYNTARKKAEKEIKTCYHPNCNLNSINSHILQKNGILSSIAEENHLWEHQINLFRDDKFYFKRTGINEVFSFKCFCKIHDNELFKKIESNKEIDFTNYESRLLFTLRTIYNEKFRKEVIIGMFELFIENGDLNDYQKDISREHINQQKLGISDIEKIELDIWFDLKNKTESFVFEVREIEQIEMCISAFYNYETTLEMNEYRIKYGYEMERISDIFLNLFPYKDKSILIMGYNKKDEKKVKSYFYTFFKESEKRLQIKLTNLFLFAFETWVVSDKFYKQKIKGIEEIFGFATKLMAETMNERLYYSLNFCSDNFKSDMRKWRKTFANNA